MPNFDFLSSMRKTLEERLNPLVQTIGQTFQNVSGSIGQRIRPPSQVRSPFSESGTLSTPEKRHFVGLNQQRTLAAQQQRIPPSVPMRPTMTPTPTATPTPIPQAPKPPLAPTIQGFHGATPSGQIYDLVQKAVRKYNLNPALFAGMIQQESGWNPTQIGYDPNDVGIMQINKRAHPEVSQEQALDPTFAIPYGARLLRNYIDQMGSTRGGVAAYNVGVRGARREGPLGQRYIENVKRNLDPDVVRELGL